MNQAQLTLLFQLKDEVSQGVEKINSSLGNLSSNPVMTGALTGAFTALSTAAIGAGAGIAAGIGSSINAAADFESAVNNLAAISGTALADAGLSFDDVSAKALELGQTTAFSASQSIAAMTELVKGGVPVVDVMGDATQATLDLASAGGLELTSAAEIVSKQLGVWGETGLTATQAADLLAQAANASTVGVEDLAMGLSNVSGTAKTAGVDFEELTQTMALIAPGFSSAADAGTSLKTFIANLQPSTGPAREAFQELGLLSFNTTKAMEALRNEGIEPLGNDTQTLATQLASLAASQGMSAEKMSEFVHSFDTSVFYDQTGAFVGMEKAADLLQNATGDLSEAEKVMALQTMFGSDAIRAAAAIANGGADGFNAMGEAMAGAGTAADVAAIQNQGFNFALDSMKGSIETLQIIIGTMLLPILTAVANQATSIIGAFSAIVTAFSDAGLASSEVWETLTMLGAALGMTDAQASAFATTAQTVASFIAANWQPILATMAGVITALVAPALISMVVAFAPVIAAVTAAIAIGAALAGAWSSNFMNIQGLTASAMAAIQAVITAVLGVILTFWQQNGAQIMSFAQQTWASVQSIIGGIVAIIMTIVTSVFGAIAGFISTHGETIQTVLGVAWKGIENVVNLTMGIIQGVVTTVLGIVEGDWQKAADGINGIVESIKTFVVEEFNRIKTVLTELGPDFISSATTIGQAIIDGIVSGISNGVAAITDAAKNAAQSALDAAKGLLGIKSPSAVFEAQVGGNIVAGLVQGLESGIGAVQSAAGNLAGATTDPFSSTPTAAPMSARGGTGNTTNEINLTINVSGGTDRSMIAQVEAAARKAVQEALAQAGQSARSRIVTA